MAREFRFVTILDVILTREPDLVGQAVRGAVFERHGFAMLGGCLSCQATISAGGAYPTRAGYWRCGDCVEAMGDGFESAADFERWSAAEDDADAEPAFRADEEPAAASAAPAIPETPLATMTYDRAAAVPWAIRESLRRYVEQRIRPGSFLQAVLANDLLGAVCRADSTNLAAIVDIAKHVHNDLEPGWCHGSYAAVERWLAGATEPE
jgi:hypothetical protein